MIVLRQVHFDNMFSYGNENILYLDQNRVTQVIGDNGKGKTSLVLILQELLYNKNSKGIKKVDIPNRYTEIRGYTGSLDFVVDDKEYLLTVERKGNKVSVELLCDGEDISEHTAPKTYKKLEEILGMSFDTFCQLVYQSSTDSLAFLKATDTTRKKFLISLLGLDTYPQVESEIKQKFSEVQRSVDQLSGQVSQLETQVDRLGKTEVSLMTFLEVPEEPTLLRDEIAETKAKIANAKETNKLILENQKRIKDRDVLEKWLDEHELPPESDIDLDALKKSLKNNEYTKKKAGELITKLGKLQGTCPTCMSEIDETRVQTMLDEAQEELDTAKSLIQKQQKEIKQVEDIQTQRELYFYKQKELEGIELLNVANDIVDIEKETALLNELTGELNSVTASITAAKKHNAEAERHNAKVSNISSQLEEAQEELDEKREKLEEHESRLGRLTVLKRAFSTKGLVAYKIESMVKDLEDLINEYLMEFSDGRFNLIFTVEGDKLNVDLTDDGINVDINTLSSGELARVNTSTLLAIRKLLSSLSSSRLNLLFLDEVLNVLDEFGKQKLIEILNKEEDLNTFIVSHGWQHPLVSKLHVEKDNNISRLEW